MRIGSGEIQRVLRISGGDLAPSLGARKKFLRTKISEMTIFSGRNVHFHAQNF